MLPRTVIHDFDVLRDRYAILPLAARGNSHIPYNTNATCLRIIDRSDLCGHPPRQA
jgi:hypothetical protein